MTEVIVVRLKEKEGDGEKNRRKGEKGTTKEVGILKEVRIFRRDAFSSESSHHDKESDQIRSAYLPDPQQDTSRPK